MPRHWLTISVLIGLVAVVILLLDSTPEVLQPSPRANQEDALLTGYLTGVNTTQYGTSGAVEYKFTADRMSHFQPEPDSVSPEDYTIINQPFFTFFQGDKSPWYIQARQGRTTQLGQLVVLKDNVRVWRESGVQEPVLVTTSELRIRPESQLVETDNFVTITHPRVVSQGGGMRADLIQETFSIFSEGSTVYEPNP